MTEVAAPLGPPDPTFDWPSVVQPGDVVRSLDATALGVVLGVLNYSHDDTPRWELLVDAAVQGSPQGAGIWEPWHAVVVDDEHSIAEAQALGLRWPVG